MVVHEDMRGGSKSWCWCNDVTYLVLLSPFFCFDIFMSIGVRWGDALRPQTRREGFEVLHDEYNDEKSVFIFFAQLMDCDGESSGYAVIIQRKLTQIPQMASFRHKEKILTK